MKFVEETSESLQFLGISVTTMPVHSMVKKDNLTHPAGTKESSDPFFLNNREA